MDQFILALDQGTTSSRAIVFDRRGRSVASAQQEFEQILPRPGVVEHDAEAIWTTQLAMARAALARATLDARQIAAIGVTNQRETTVVWDRATGRPVANAVVWQSRISAPICERLRRRGLESLVRERTGLLIDPYFSGSKIVHLLETVDGLRAAAARGDVLFGTIDSWLNWRLTGGRVHATDASNASRTMLMNLATLDWDEELLAAFEVPRAMLPEILPCDALFGHAAPEHFGRAIPITGVAGDQQAATFGQTCYGPGAAKNTYGTGCFLLLNIGRRPQLSENRLLTTVGWRLEQETTYCLEGSVFIGGAIVQWLRDGLKLIRNAGEIESLAASVPDNGGICFVPALVGLGAPHWNSYARGTILGITRGTTGGHIARAALEAIAHQTCDLVEAMQRDAGLALDVLRVDGGASANALLMQMQADLLGVPVERPVERETTALGAAFIAGLSVGYWRDLAELSGLWARDALFHPAMDPPRRAAQRARWRDAVTRSFDWERCEAAETSHETKHEHDMDQ